MKNMSIVDKFFRIHLRHIKLFHEVKLLNLSDIVDDKNHEFGWVRYQNRFFNH